MCQGKKICEQNLADYKNRQKDKSNFSAKDKDTLRDLKLVQEMYARGLEFEPIDLYRAHSRNFQVIDGKIMPSLSSIDGLGEKAADAIMEAARHGEFLSQDDFRARTKVSKTVIELMDRLGILGDMPESNQISIFDLIGAE
jgi:DNA polymerase-3 subunit alpha (Gram-positive type)